jgi:hypothetical protein
MYIVRNQEETAPVQLDQNHQIDEPDSMLRSIEYNTGTKPELSMVTDFMRTNNGLTFYFDKTLAPSKENGADTVYCWKDTGIRSRKGDPIFVSFLPKREGYVGHYTAPALTLGDLAKKYYAKEPNIENKMEENLREFIGSYPSLYESYRKEHENDPEPVSGPTEPKAVKTVSARGIHVAGQTSLGADTDAKEVLKQVRELLMVNNWKSSAGLMRYINIIGDRMCVLVTAGRTEYYIKNSTGGIIVNTGLIDNYGEDIQILYRKYSKDNRFHPYCVIKGKQDKLDNGFKKEDTVKQILPVSFFDPGTPTFFQGQMEDFDISLHSLSHIIQDRRDRFPEVAAEMSDSALANRMKDAIRLGVTMQERDHSFIKASYSTSIGGVSWIFPFHIAADIFEAPEMALIVRKTGEFFEIKTVVPYDDNLRDRLRCLALYS